jgi:hypothetical protein
VAFPPWSDAPDAANLLSALADSDLDTDRHRSSWPGSTRIDVSVWKQAFWPLLPSGAQLPV